jgi:AraC family ethanolamine operon transcriptional activator
MQQGFYELGRFSQYYLAMFGERPSQTLGIAAVQAAEDEIARASRFEPGPRTTP